MTGNAIVTGQLIAAGLDPEDTWRIVRGALDEDLRYGPDITSAATAAPGAQAVAGVVAREPGVLAGLPVALAVLAAGGIPPETAEPRHADGDPDRPGHRGAADPRPAPGTARCRGHPAQRPHPPVRDRHHETRAWADALAGTGCAVRDTREPRQGSASSRSTPCAAAAAPTTGWAWAMPR